jgi:hypothetical protein
MILTPEQERALKAILQHYTSHDLAYESRWVAHDVATVLGIKVNECTTTGAPCPCARELDVAMEPFHD